MVFALMAIIAIGAWPAFLNYNLSGKSLVHCVNISNAKILLVDDEIASSIESIKNEIFVDIYVYNTSRLNDRIISEFSTAPPDTSLRRGVSLTDPSMLIYTSGTTGLPKAAIVPYSMLLMASKALALWIDLKPDDRFYTCMPLYHASALVYIAGLFCSLTAGTPFVISHKFSPCIFWEEVRSSRATVIQYGMDLYECHSPYQVGETCRYLLAAPPSQLDKHHSVRAVFGNGMRPDVWEKFRQRFGISSILEFYGATEGIGGYLNYNTGPRGVGAVAHFGKIANLLARNKHAIVRVDFQTQQLVRGLDGFCVKVGPNEPGELLIRVTKDSIRPYKGYFRNQRDSEKKIEKDVFVVGDTFFRSGDVLKFDKDGFWYFDDRIGDTFRWKGENQVSALLGTFPGIVEANVYGIRLPNHDGRAGCAALITSKDVDLVHLSDYMKQNLPLFAIPVFLRFVKEMEVTGNNKQLKANLRQEGADPAKTGGNRMCWFYKNQYVEFKPSDWQKLLVGKARL